MRVILSKYLLGAVFILWLGHIPSTRQADREDCSGTTFCQSGTFPDGGQAFVDCHFPVDVNQTKANFLVAKQRNCKKDDLSDTVISCEWTNGDLSCDADDWTLRPAVVRGSWLRLKMHKVHPRDAGRYFCAIVPPVSEESSEACFLVVSKATESNQPDTTMTIITPTDKVTSGSVCLRHGGEASASFGTFVTLLVVCVLAATTL